MKPHFQGERKVEIEGRDQTVYHSREKVLKHKFNWKRRRVRFSEKVQNVDFISKVIRENKFISYILKTRRKLLAVVNFEFRQNDSFSKRRKRECIFFFLIFRMNLK